MNGRTMRKVGIDTVKLYKYLDELEVNLDKIGNVLRNARNLSENEIKYYTNEAQTNIEYIIDKSNGSGYLSK